MDDEKEIWLTRARRLETYRRRYWIIHFLAAASVLSASFTIPLGHSPKQLFLCLMFGFILSLHISTIRFYWHRFKSKRNHLNHI